MCPSRAVTADWQIIVGGDGTVMSVATPATPSFVAWSLRSRSSASPELRSAMAIRSVDGLITLEDSRNGRCGGRDRCGRCRWWQIAVLPGGNSSQHLFLIDRTLVIRAISHRSDQGSAPTLARSRHEIG